MTTRLRIRRTLIVRGHSTGLEIILLFRSETSCTALNENNIISNRYDYTSVYLGIGKYLCTYNVYGG